MGHKLWWWIREYQCGVSVVKRSNSAIFETLGTYKIIDNLTLLKPQMNILPAMNGTISKMTFRVVKFNNTKLIICGNNLWFLRF